MAILNERNLPKIIVTLAASLTGLVISQASQAIDYSAIVGLNVTHSGANSYYDYTKPAKEVGERELVVNPETNGKYWRTTESRSKVKMNEGLANKNQLIGFRAKIDNYAISAVTYRNSFYTSDRKDRSFGLGVSHVWQPSQNIKLEAGAMLLTGYREALLTENESKSTSQELIAAPMFSIEYKLTQQFSLTQTLQGNAHVTALKINL